MLTQEIKKQDFHQAISKEETRWLKRTCTMVQRMYIEQTVQ